MDKKDNPKMRHWFLKIITVPVIISVCLCFKSNRQEDVTINLGYTLDYDKDTLLNKKIGLKWALSFLGATLPKDSYEKSMSNFTENSFELNLSTLGFSQKALAALKLIVDSLKKMPDYQKRKKTDLGLFVSLTLGSSWHYYKITGAEETLDEFFKQHRFSKQKNFSVTSSAVATHNRLLKYSVDSDNPMEWAFIAEEGKGSIKENTFLSEAFEVCDIMPNGQLRFSIYNKNGNLIDASPSYFGAAGKPAKCLWCHETAISPLFTKNETLINYMSPDEFNADVAVIMKKLTAYRATLNSDLDFSKAAQEHTQMELIYISYMQPSADRLAQEWDMSKEEVSRLIKHLKSSRHEEFKFLGDIFNRTDVQKETCLFPQSIREPCPEEPNFFKSIHY